MNKAITIELEFFLISILWGVILLLAYDILRILRRVIKHNVFIIATQDLIFWVVSSVFIFAMMYKQNNGIIRGFSIMGMLIGMVLYHEMLSEAIVEMISKLILLLLRPLKFAINQLIKFLLFIGSKGKKAFLFILLRLKKLTKSVKLSIEKKKQTNTIKRTKRNSEKLAKKHKKQEKKQQAVQQKQMEQKKQAEIERLAKTKKQAEKELQAEKKKKSLQNKQIEKKKKELQDKQAEEKKKELQDKQAEKKKKELQDKQVAKKKKVL